MQSYNLDLKLPRGGDIGAKKVHNKLLRVKGKNHKLILLNWGFSLLILVACVCVCV
jgi:hypothetical protein